MSLKFFHIVFITCSFVLALGFGVWCVQSRVGHGHMEYLGLGIASFATGAALLGYGVWFLRKMERWNEDAARKKTSPIRDDSRGSGDGAGAASRSSV
jgi:hypothetical protein